MNNSSLAFTFIFVSVLSFGWHGRANRLDPPTEPVISRHAAGLPRSPAPKFTSSPAPQVNRSPNFIIIFADDLGYGDIGPFNTSRDASRPTTPNLDRMAREGIRLTNFYVAQAVCSASRMALLTGAYPNRVGITGALNHTARHGINADEVTIAEVLKQRGYATAIFGKWHLGHHQPFLPVHHGFDEYLGLPYSNDMWPHHPQQKNFYPDLPLIERDAVIKLDPDQSQLTRMYTERAVSFVERHRDRPFFLYVPHSMPHVPLFVSERFKGKSAGGLYGDVIAEIDWSVGQILDAVKRAGLDDNTMVIFTSDNGPWMSYGNHAGSPGPFRESKGTAFEGGVRVPFVARWPGRIPKGMSASPAMTIDLLPTLARLAGATVPSKLDPGGFAPPDPPPPPQRAQNAPRGPRSPSLPPSLARTPRELWRDLAEALAEAGAGIPFAPLPPPLKLRRDLAEAPSARRRAAPAGRAGSAPRIDGRDIWPLIGNQRGAKSPHEALYFFWGTELHAIRSGRWKLHLPHPYQSLESAGKDGSPGKYVRKQIELSLFDLEKDPGESMNVADQNPAVVRQLLEHAERAREDLGDSLTKRTGKNVRAAGSV